MYGASVDLARQWLVFEVPRLGEKRDRVGGIFVGGPSYR